MITHHLFQRSFDLQFRTRIEARSRLGRARLRRALIKPDVVRSSRSEVLGSRARSEHRCTAAAPGWDFESSQAKYGLDRVSPYLLFMATALLSVLSALAASGAPADPTPLFTTELIFPLHHQHNHAPAIVECPNGDLLVSWYRGSGERQADDVAVYGARRLRKHTQWSEPFLMVDTPGFPDCNTAMFIDSRQRLWLFWPIILANSWESCITSYRVASHYELEGRTPRVPIHLRA